MLVNESFKNCLLNRHVCGRTVVQYCCCLIAILTAWKKFLKISHRKGITRVKNGRDVMCLPARDVTVTSTFKLLQNN